MPSRSRSPSALALLLVAATVSACKEDEPRETPPVDLSSCSRPWRGLYAVEDVESKNVALQSTLAVHDGEVFVVHGGPIRDSDVLAVEPRTRTVRRATTVPSGRGMLQQLWVAGDDLLLRTSGHWDAVPLRGGPMRPVSTLPRPEGETLDGGYVFDGQNLSWVRWELRRDGTVWSFWQLPKDGGAAREVGRLDVGEHPLPGVGTVLGEGVLFRGEPAYKGWWVSRQGGPVIQYGAPTTPSTLMAALPDGTLLWQPSDQVHRGVIARHGQDGTPSSTVAFSFPEGARAVAAWPDPAGAFLVETRELTSHGTQHSSFWLVNAAGETTRLACDPQPERRRTLAAATTSTEVYLVVELLAGKQTELVTFPRAPHP